MSSWVADTPSIRSRLIKLIDETELNAWVINVKDNTGVITWDERMKGLPEFIEELHKENIYVIPRIVSFKDPAYVKAHPLLAVTKVKQDESGGIIKGSLGSTLAQWNVAVFGHKCKAVLCKRF